MAHFGTVPPEPPRLAAVDRLAPAMQRALPLVIADVLAATGAAPRVFETLRTDERQQWLYGFARQYDDGRGSVTQLPTALTGWHFYGLAVDLIHPTLDWDAPAAWWQALGHAYERHGLTWGGHWHSRDLPHGQWGRCAVSPRRSPELYRHGGRIAVWRAVAAL